MTARESLENVKDAVKESVAYQLKQIKENDAVRIDDLPDFVFEAVDTEIAGLSRAEQMEIVDHFGGEENVDKGLIDNSSLDKAIATTAFGVLEQEVYSDSEMSELSDKLQYTVDYEEAQEMLKEIEE
jgi:hypothetical protein